VLKRVKIGYLAMAGEGWPYAVPINFAYADPVVYFHGGGELKASLLACLSTAPASCVTFAFGGG
jgi:nitroimidazol reductase NimA-like FMN-containing flavoprotein (pyridoxamine 5'-phosphate oxidase superfamily)